VIRTGQRLGRVPYAANREIVEIPSTDPRFGKMEGLVAVGRAKILGERYDKDAALWRAYSVNGQGYSKNPEEMEEWGVDPNFYTNAVRDYADWQEKWWREAIQNSVDAGAHRIVCTVEQLPDQTWRVTITDDGVGMTVDLMRRKLFTEGATGKVGAQGVGGFGKAKELLLLPWISYEILSRKAHAVGRNKKFKITEKPQEFPGTILTVIMPNDLHTNPEAAINYIKKCNIPDIDFIVNGKRYLANTKVGDVIKEIPYQDGKVTIYHSSHRYFQDQALHIRAKGPRGQLWMFEMRLSPDAKGTYIAEFPGEHSTAILAANRDGFRINSITWQIQEFVNGLSKDEQQILRAKKNLIRHKVRGSGRFSGAASLELERIFYEAIGATGTGEGRPIILSPDQQASWAKMAGQVNRSSQPEREIAESAPAADQPVRSPGLPFNMKTPMDAVYAISSIPFTGPKHIEAAIKQIAWEPDFYLVNDEEGFRVPAGYYPQTMSPRNVKLLRFWAEMCRFILIQLNCSIPYGVGFYFSNSTLGSHIQDEDGHWLLFNPYKWNLKSSEVHLGGDKYLLSDRQDIYTIYSIAVHECTHMSDGMTYHDAAFATALTRNVGLTAGKDRQVRAILRSIRSRRTP
jgi:hypothetical protein